MTTIDREQFWEDCNGHLIPVSKIKPIDKLRHEMVVDIFGQAKSLHDFMKTVKEAIFETIYAFNDLSVEQYGAKPSKQKNTAYFSFDRKYKIEYAIGDYIKLDERIHAAKSLIDQCLIEWTKDSNDELKTLISNAFNVDKLGNLSTHRILALKRYDIQHEKWKEAMQAISDSIQVIGSKSYIRVYELQGDGSYKMLPLDFAKIQGGVYDCKKNRKI